MKLKSLYLIVIMLSMSNMIFAQEKYEQAIVGLLTNGASSNLIISIEGQPSLKEKVTDHDGATDFSPILSRIAKMRTEGWEVWNSSTTSNVTYVEIIYFLRRKLR